MLGVQLALLKHWHILQAGNPIRCVKKGDEASSRLHVRCCNQLQSAPQLCRRGR